MFKVIKEIHFCYGHRLLNYKGSCEHLHGHSSKVEIELSSKHLSDEDLVFDFLDIKRIVKQWIDQELDHKMFLDKKDPLVPLLEKAGEPLVLFDGNPSAERIAEKIFKFVKSQKLPVTEVRVWETLTSCAIYSEAS